MAVKITAGILIVFFFLGSVMPFTDFRELSKFPHLIEHYTLHNNSAKGALDFYEFLEMHYGDDQAAHHDEHQHKGCLPLQSLTHGGVVFVFAKSISVTAGKQQTEAETEGFYLPPSSSPSLNQPWHPPKV